MYARTKKGRLYYVGGRKRTTSTTTATSLLGDSTSIVETGNHVSIVGENAINSVQVAPHEEEDISKVRKLLKAEKNIVHASRVSTTMHDTAKWFKPADRVT